MKLPLGFLLFILNVHCVTSILPSRQCQDIRSGLSNYYYNFSPLLFNEWLTKTNRRQ